GERPGPLGALARGGLAPRALLVRRPRDGSPPDGEHDHRPDPEPSRGLSHLAHLALLVAALAPFQAAPPVPPASRARAPPRAVPPLGAKRRCGTRAFSIGSTRCSS